MTRVTNSRRNFAKSGASKAVIPTDDRAGLNQEGPSSLARHIQLPELPVDGDLAFEAQAALFAVVLLVCQQLQLHRAGLALLVTYYAALQPCCFVPPSLHLEPWALAQHGLLAWLAALTLHASRLFPPRYLDSLHRAALHLGRWRRLEARHVHAPHHLPAVVVGGALALQAAQLLFLLYVLASSSEWHRLLTASLLVLLNSLTLFKLARQYLVLDKVYHAERLLHERLAS
ncbi:hypothetical protein HPB51_016041 [Rhipicephalus microplus]|uniref:Uncharacterized protein n=1 Tax=Rhipicephalus microplus TaxID=6941 RepID=A0A9J6DHK1_RHIMP|nr:hypothetical protein HPB51_016041 [Rhipicephalus microplus]